MLNWKTTGHDVEWQGREYSWRKDIQFKRYKELAGRLAATIREFQQSHPGTSAAEIKHALRLASSGFATSLTGPLVAVGLGLMFAAGLAVFMFARSPSFDPTAPAFPMVLIALVVLALVGVFVALRR